jgi:hypothetical protein
MLLPAGSIGGRNALAARAAAASFLRTSNFLFEPARLTVHGTAVRKRRQAREISQRRLPPEELQMPAGELQSTAPTAIIFFQCRGGLAPLFGTNTE